MSVPCIEDDQENGSYKDHKDVICSTHRSFDGNTRLLPCSKCNGRKISIWREHNNQCYNLSCVSCGYTLECSEDVEQSIKLWNKEEFR